MLECECEFTYVMKNKLIPLNIMKAVNVKKHSNQIQEELLIQLYYKGTFGAPRDGVDLCAIRSSKNSHVTMQGKARCYSDLRCSEVVVCETVKPQKVRS